MAAISSGGQMGGAPAFPAADNTSRAAAVPDQGHRSPAMVARLGRAPSSPGKGKVLFFTFLANESDRPAKALVPDAEVGDRSSKDRIIVIRRVLAAFALHRVTDSKLGENLRVNYP